MRWRKRSPTEEEMQFYTDAAAFVREIAAAPSTETVAVFPSDKLASDFSRSAGRGNAVLSNQQQTVFAVVTLPDSEIARLDRMRLADDERTLRVLERWEQMKSTEIDRVRKSLDPNKRKWITKCFRDRLSPPRPGPPSSNVWAAIGGVFVVFVLAAIASLAALYVSETRRAENEAKQQKAEQEKLQKRVSDLATKHNAMSDWRKEIKATALERIYTASLTPPLVRQDGRPILLIAPLKDVTSSEGKYQAIFEARANIVTPIRFVLDCDDSQARLLMSFPGQRNAHFAVIATVRALESTGGSGEDQALALARGKCVDLIPVGTYDGLDQVFNSFPDKAPK